MVSFHFDRLLTLRESLGFWSALVEYGGCVAGLSSGRGFEDLMFIDKSKEALVKTMVEDLLTEASSMLTEEALMRPLREGTPTFETSCVDWEREQYLLKAMAPHWLSLFRKRVLTSHTLIDSPTIAFLQKIIDLYVRKQEAHSGHRTPPAHLLQLAKGLSNYLRTHRLDCGNVLIGLPVAKTHSTRIFGSSTTTTTTGKPEPALSDVLAELAKITDPAALQERVRLLATRHAKQTDVAITYAVGDLVVYNAAEANAPTSDHSGGRSNGNSHCFARVIDVHTSELGQKSLLITDDPLELTTLKVSVDRVRPIDGVMTAHLASVEGLYRLIDDPVFDFFNRISSNVSYRIRLLLWEQQLDPEMLFDKPKLLPVRFADGWDIDVWETNVATLQALTSNLKIAELLKEIDGQTYVHAVAFVKQLATDKLLFFQVNQMRKDIIEYTRDPCSPDRGPAESAHLHTLWETVVEEAQRWLERLQHTRKEFVEGTRKEQLTEWWLGLIDAGVHKYLSERGYILNALPEDYIRDRPTNIAHVHSNLALVRQLLDPNHEGRALMTAFVDNLKSTIYREIDGFIFENQMLLRQTFKLKLSPEDFKSPAWLEQVRTSLTNASTSRISESLLTWASDFLEDYEYLLEMQRMEEAEFSATGGDQRLRLSSVVPISGLIIGKFTMIENELATAISLWEEEDEQLLKQEEHHQSSDLSSTSEL